MTDIDDEITCPVCRIHTNQEALDAERLVASAALAMINRDQEAIELIYNTATPYDFHIAVTIYARLAAGICEYSGVDVESLLEDARSFLNSEQA